MKKHVGHEHEHGWTGTRKHNKNESSGTRILYNAKINFCAVTSLRRTPGCDTYAEKESSSRIVLLSFEVGFVQHEPKVGKGTCQRTNIAVAIRLQRSSRSLVTCSRWWLVLLLLLKGLSYLDPLRRYRKIRHVRCSLL